MLENTADHKVKTKAGETAGKLGLIAIGLFIVSFLVFTNLNTEFDYIEDFVSRLGAKGAPYAILWNIFGFLSVGIILIGFGIAYGRHLKDKLTGLLLAVFGIGFAFTAIPFDLTDTYSAVSKAHTAAITLGLASWLFGLARISYKVTLGKTVRLRANVTAVLLVLSMIGGAIEFWPMPMTQRLVFTIVFGWTAITSVNLLFIGNKKISQTNPN